MLKPPAPTMPGMTDTLDFVKNLWGSMNIPGTAMSGLASPTLSSDDLDKRIADLKAVESWLNMNISMLRGTIQAMEVQRGTLTALKSMGASMAEAMRQSGVSADKMAGMPFAPFFNPAAQPAGGKPSTTAPPSSPSSSAPVPGAAAAAAPSGGADNAQHSAGAGAPAGADGAAAAMGMPAAVAWWNLLQDQFRQAVTTAMNSAASAPPGAPASASTPPAPDAAEAKAAAPAPASTPKNESAAGNSGNGNGKPRTPRSRADKS